MPVRPFRATRPALAVQLWQVFVLRSIHEKDPPLTDLGECQALKNTGLRFERLSRMNLCWPLRPSDVALG